MHSFVILTFSHMQFSINYSFQLGIINFEKNMFLLLKFGKNSFCSKFLNPINSYKYSAVIKMKFVFQEIQMDSKHLQWYVLLPLSLSHSHHLSQPSVFIIAVQFLQRLGFQYFFIHTFCVFLSAAILKILFQSF